MNEELKLQETVVNEIQYPNNIPEHNRVVYNTEQGFRFRKILKNGEMAHINWWQIYLKRGSNISLCAEIKESICDLYYRIKKLEISDGYYMSSQELEKLYLTKETN